MDETRKRRQIKWYFWSPPSLKWAATFAILGLLSVGRSGQEVAGCVTSLIFATILFWVAIVYFRTSLWFIPKIEIPWITARLRVVLVSVTFGVWTAASTPYPSLILGCFAGLALLPRILHDTLRPEDATIDRWLREDLEKFESKAQLKLNLVKEELEHDRPLIVTGPVIDEDDDRAKMVLGKDQEYRFSVHQVLILLLTCNHLAVFRARYDSRTDITYFLSLKDIGYEHIVEVEILEELELHDGEERKTYTVRGKKFYPSQIFRLGLTSSRDLRVPTRLRNEKHDESEREPLCTPPLCTPIDEISRALRSVTRNHH